MKPKTKMIKYFIRVLLLNTIILSQTANCQNKKDKISVSTVGSVFFNSKRNEYRNGEQGIYKELRLSYSLDNNFEVGIFAGHQWRSFIYYTQTPNCLCPLFMDRYYVPVGIHLRLDFTDFLEKASIVKNVKKWELYNQIIVTRLLGKDERDSRETNQDIIVYNPSYVIDYGKVYMGFLIGVSYYPLKKTGIFLEGGDGAIATLQIGIKIRL